MGRAAQLLCFAALAPLCSCHRVSELRADVPAAVTHLAMLVLDASGGLVASTPLVPWVAGQAPRLEAEADQIPLLVGFSDAQLLATPDQHPLELASGCVPSLPAPLWAARWEKEALAPAGEIPSLTAGWLRNQCPDPSKAQVIADAPCVAQRCIPRVLQTGDCALSIDLSDCAVGQIDARLEPDGTLCVEPSSVITADCKVELSARFQTVPPPFSFEPITVFEAAPFLPDTLVRMQPPLTPDMMQEGHLFDLAVLDDRVLVAAPPDEQPVTGCVPGPPYRLFSYGLDRTPIATSTVPTCFMRMRAGPDGSSFAAVFGEQSNWAIGRFDRDGKLIKSVPLEPTLPVSNNEPRSLLMLTDPPRVAILFYYFFGASSNRIHLWSWPDLAPAGYYEMLDISTHPAEAMTAAGPNTLVLTTADNRHVRWFDLPSGHFTHDQAVPSEVQVALNLLDPYYDADTDSVLVPAHTSLYRLDTSGSPPLRKTVAEVEGGLVTLHRWPKDPALVLAAGSTPVRGKRQTQLMLYDRLNKKFLPGWWSVGPGMAGRVEEDRQGQLWILSPWDAQLIRLTPN